MVVIIKCDICEKIVDKTEQTKGFGAISIINRKYTFVDYKRKDGGNLMQTNFDVCSECCEKLMKFLKELKPTEELNSENK